MEEKNLPAIKIIQQIKEGLINPQELSRDARQLVVKLLLMELMPVTKIAAFLKTNDRTIQRDKYEIKQRCPEKPSLNTTPESLIELMRKNEIAMQQLRTLSKPEQAKAARYLWKSIQEQMKILQRLGYLPKQPNKKVKKRNKKSK